MEFVYLLTEREFLKTGESIHKIGRSSRENAKRFNDYPSGSKLLLFSSCKDSRFIEKEIKKIFGEKYIQRIDIGNEYFEGCCIQMRHDIFEIIKKFDLLTPEEIMSVAQKEVDEKKEKMKERKRLIEKEKEKNEELKIKIKELKQKQKNKLEKIINDMKESRTGKNIEKVNKNKLLFPEFLTMWFQNNYKRTNDIKDLSKLKDIYYKFQKTKFYKTLSKIEKRTYNKSFFKKALEEHKIFGDDYKNRYTNYYRSVMLGWRVRENPNNTEEYGEENPNDVESDDNEVEKYLSDSEEELDSSDVSDE